MRLMRVFLRVEDVIVSEVTVARQTHYNSRGNYHTHPQEENYHTQPIAGVSTIATSERSSRPMGRIRLLDITYDTTVRDGSRTVTDRPRYTSVGETMVSRPSWVGHGWERAHP